ncbi:MAG: hypothetical protein HGB02_07225 [Chlorobiaceae bacterium]|nr:hypothetical protein [Chlorobiaceae bacterium]
MADNRDLKTVLLKARGVDWCEAYKAATDVSGSREEWRYYGQFMTDDSPDNRWLDICEREFSGISYWRHMTADEIMIEINGTNGECRWAFSRILRRYWSACVSYLLDIAPTNEWETYLLDRFQDKRVLMAEEVPVWSGKDEDCSVKSCRFLDELQPVNIRILFERVYAIQEIEGILAELAAANTSAAIGDGAPRDQAEGLERAKRGGKTKLPDDVFMSEIFPGLDKEFPWGGKNEGLIARCREIGAQYDVSGSTIKRKFYDAQGQ